MNWENILNGFNEILKSMSGMSASQFNILIIFVIVLASIFLFFYMIRSFNRTSREQAKISQRILDISDDNNKRQIVQEDKQRKEDKIRDERMRKHDERMGKTRSTYY